MKKYFIGITAFLLAILLILLSACTDKNINPDTIITTDNVSITEKPNDGNYGDKPVLVVPQSAVNSPTEKWLYDSQKNHNINAVALWELEDRMAEYVEFEQSGGGAVVIARNGYIVYDNKEGYFNNFGYTYPNEIWSLTKSFVSALIGIAIDEGYIKSVDDKVLDYFKDWDIDNIDEMKEAMTIKDVLTMRAGLNWTNENSASRWVKDNANPVLKLLSMEMKSQPGTEWEYNTASSSILTAIIQQATGMSAFEYAKEKLFGPLGITEVAWETDKAGVNTGGFGLQMLTLDLLKFGQLFLKNGEWDGKQIISKEWVKESTTCDIDADNGKELYGYHWWGLKGVDEGEYLLDSMGYSITLKEAIQDGEIYRATGYGGQFIYVWPKYDIVVVIQNNFYVDIYSDRSVWGKYDSDIGHNIVLVDVLASIVEAVEYTENPESKSFRQDVNTEMTGELVIYASPNTNDMINSAVKIYKRQYPNVEINYAAFDDYGSYINTMQTEVAAGKVPDLWIGSEFDFFNFNSASAANIFTAADDGIFEDLTEFMKNSDTDWSLYNKTVLDAGIYKGKQYFMPLGYILPVIMTTEEIMREEQIDFNAIKTYPDLLKAIRQVQQKYTADEKGLFFNVNSSRGYDAYSYNYFPHNGMDFINYETGGVIDDSETFRDTMEVMKWSYAEHAGNYYGNKGVDLRDKNILFSHFNTAIMIQDFVHSYGTVLYDNSPLYMPFPGIDGKVTANVHSTAAVFKNSENKQNAYNFIKILLSDKIQSNPNNWNSGIPVLKSALEAHIDKVLQNQQGKPYRVDAGEYYPDSPEFYVAPVPQETILEFADMLTNVDRCVVDLSEALNYKFWDEIFLPYFKNEKTYEQFYADFKNALELYMKE